MREMSADKAYSSKAHIKLASELGMITFIPFKTSAKGKSRGSGSFAWKTMFLYYHKYREEFSAHYHKRSNIESTFAMVKARFGGSVRCKNKIAQDNEILLKCLCHNICVLIQEVFLNNIPIDFKKCSESFNEHKRSN